MNSPLLFLFYHQLSSLMRDWKPAKVTQNRQAHVLFIEMQLASSPAA